MKHYFWEIVQEDHIGFWDISPTPLILINQQMLKTNLLLIVSIVVHLNLYTNFQLIQDTYLMY